MNDFERAEATDAIMAVVEEMGVLWGGELFPEVVDAEYFDCQNTLPCITADKNSGGIPWTLVTSTVKPLQVTTDRIDEMQHLMTIVTTLAKRYGDELIPADLDGMLFDHPVRTDHCDDVPVIRFE